MRVGFSRVGHSGTHLRNEYLVWRTGGDIVISFGFICLGLVSEEASQF